jgi:uncharacterized protein
LIKEPTIQLVGFFMSANCHHKCTASNLGWTLGGKRRNVHFWKTIKVGGSMRKVILLMLLLVVSISALSGQAIADSRLDADRAFNAGNYEEAEKLYRPLAKLGESIAQDNLGYMYATGQGISKDYQEAAKWWRLAAEQGNADAQLNLGTMFNNGNGVPQNYVEAVKWFRLAAEQGAPRAQSDLGWMYEIGEGIPQSLVLADMWYNIAAGNVNTSDTVGQTNYPLRRETLEKHMTAQQIAEAQELAKKCTANRFKGCY